MPTPVKTARWPPSFLEGRRNVADPPADAVVRAIYERGDVAAVDALLGGIFRSDEPVPPGLPPEAVAYFAETSRLPDWAEARLIARGQDLFTRAGWSIGGALFCSALPQAYASAHGARVLVQTQGMTRHVRQRIFETAQFLFDVLDAGALGEGGRGVRAAQRVRLMHAGVRHLLLARASPAWDSARFGMPINQEDLAGTLTTFSIVPLQAIRLLGESVSAADEAAWIHTWNVVGTLLGIERELLPEDFAQGQALKQEIESRQWAPSAEGRKLASDLVGMMQSYLPLPARGLPIAMIRHLAGARCADLLGLRPNPWTPVIKGAVSLASSIERQVTLPLHRLFFAPFTHWLMKRLVLDEREGKQARFRIPLSLRRSIDPRY